jgi:hypothetical protein
MRWKINFLTPSRNTSASPVSRPNQAAIRNNWLGTTLAHDRITQLLGDIAQFVFEPLGYYRGSFELAKIEREDMGERAASLGRI